MNCFGKKNAEWIEDYNRQYHETAMNANRVVEKTLSNLMTLVEDSSIGEDLDKAKYSLEEMRTMFGMNEVVQFEKEITLFSEELLEIGYHIAFVENIVYEKYIGPVYDLTVEDDTSYTINGVAVHNSAAGSLVSYAIGITNVDPIKYSLLFERFLNPKRGKLPDIDLDFCIKNRGRVMNYIMERFGKEHVANIATFGRLQTKAVIKDVGKVMGIPYEDVNNFTKLLPSGPGANIHISDIYHIPECKPFVDKYPDLFQLAGKLEGSPRHVGQHAAGMVVSPPEYPIWSLIPIQRGKEVIEGVEAGYLTQLEKGPVEDLGLKIA
ncbi:DNA polymerase III subunit alpha [compost metagenome]